MSDETSGAGSGPDVDATNETRAETAGDTAAEADGATAADTESALDDAHHALREAQARLAEVPADVVVTNHVMGLYELAAIHLSAEQPDMRAAALAIDSVACLVEGLGDRLGQEASTMRDALGNIRLAFVE
ncbi:MAG: hypothetical protein ACRDZZ_11605, partial [Ilumatobacteraceae bacterium]